MKMQKVIKSSVSYPVGLTIKPIIFTAVAMVALSGCGGNKLSPHKVIKPLPPVQVNADKNIDEPKEPEGAGGMSPVQPIPAPR